MAAAHAPNTVGEPSVRAYRLHQPRRALLAAAELLLAIALAVLAVWLWRTGVVTDTLPAPAGQEPREVSRYLGNRLALSAGSGCLAGVLLLDAIRQWILGTRVDSGIEPEYGPVAPGRPN
ncbi:hypothetical protein [Actinoalloteichus hymeniacidonis]|nr:hypothetical protein [Actinoalloteichus hymeniacidonis]MBB5910673.1 hypothetical protein [Actinoalloteichus hymeniacidonis]